MFARPPDTDTVTIHVDGAPVAARAGDSVAAALIAAGIVATRTTPVSDSPRGPYCMMGVCFECLMVIDGIASRQACLTPVREGMRVERQRGARPLDIPPLEKPPLEKGDAA
jgi:predicted molibdopterin-dependent oxidoreductase YjgC